MQSSKQRSERMSTKLDSPSTVEPRHGLSAATVSVSSTVSATSPKVSMFGAKAGFVIPKNKLSGSLVPIFRGGSKIDAGSMVKEESSKQVQRKTKWGIDLTQDATVRKGKALAYQTRVEQITQQLKYGSLEFEDDQVTESPQASSTDAASNPVDSKSHKLEILELERRELIGEILRLNPSYKPPIDYKPLLKESNVPIPIKKYPGYNFIGLLLGPESHTQKRLEEETGAKVRVYGTKSGLVEKREITKSDIGEAQDTLEDLYVHVSADTYEKVDVAVALIELLLTPVSGNLGVTPEVTSSSSGNNTDIQASKGSGFLPTPVTAVIPTLPQPSSLPIQHGQPPFQPFQASWFPTNFPPHPSSSFMPPVSPNNLNQFPLLRAPPAVPPYITHPPNTSSLPRTSLPHVLRPQLPIQYPPRQSSPVTISQSLTTLRPSGAMNPQIGPPIRALVTPPVSFSGWTPAPNISSRPSMNQMIPPLTMRPLSTAVRSAPPSSDPPQFNVSVTVMRPPTNFTPHSTPFSSRPSMTPLISSSPLPQIGFVSTPRRASSSSGSPMPPPSPTPTPMSLASPSPRPTSSVQLAPSASVPIGSPMLMPSPSRVPAPIPVQPPQPPAIPTSKSSTASPVTASKPLRPISGDFTFQPLRTQPPSPSPNPPAPKAPSFRPVLQNSVPIATAAPITAFPANPSNTRPPPSLLQGYTSVTPAIPVGSPGFPRPPQAPNPSRPPPAYPSNFQQVHQNHQPIHLSRPGGSFTVPNRPLDGKSNGSMPGNARMTVGGNQIYDPFSPTVSPAPPHQGVNTANVEKPETDAEYEDLMASVGVK